MKNHIVIKFNKEAIQSRTNEALMLKTFATQDNFLNQFTYRSIVTDEMLSPQKKINTVNFENLVGICCVQGLDEMPVEEKESLAKKMDAYDFVEYAYVEILDEMKLPHNPNADEEYPFYKKGDKIPDFTDLQGYKDGIEDDHIGIDMEYAWDIGVAGEGIQIADIENSFNPKHINLKRDSLITLGLNEDDGYADHGTAVAGIMYATDMGLGIKGMVHGADAYYFVSIDGSIAEGIAKGLEVLKTGDVFIYEQQTPLKAPIDHIFAVDDITREATEAGIIIIMAAGNGNLDLDNDERFKDYIKRRDNKSIRVGAGNSRLNRAEFSTYGSIVHLQGWGVRNIVTTGYGDLYDGGMNKEYTGIFSGTSSATPIVASAVVAVQSWYKQETGDVLSPLEMRDLLIETGIPQADPKGGHIGPIPNVRNAINTLRDRLNPPKIKAVINGPMRINGGKKVILSGENSISKAANIVSYDWALPKGITADRLDQSTLTFIAPELSEIQKFLISLTVIDERNNSDSVEHILFVNEVYLLWEPDINYFKGSKVNWKNKSWEARKMNMNVEPGTDSEIWKEL